MEDRIAELSRYRIEKAKADLEGSEIMFKNDKFAQSLNRSYYSMFHATRALLALDKYDSKKHSGIIAYFNQQYIKTGKLEMKYGQMLMLAEKIRIKCDYDDFFIASKQQAGDQLEHAREFIQRIDGYINKSI